jgi:hypothetical protein
MNDTLRKTLIYFAPLNTYWKGSDTGALSLQPGVEGCYPLKFMDRLTSGHYRWFDKDGVPVNKKGVHNYTTVCSYALANWETYLTKGTESHRETFLKIAGFLLEQSEGRADGSVLLWDEAAHRLSAMYQGEAMSVFVRAWGCTQKESFLQAAKGCVLPLTRKVVDCGVAGVISHNGAVWYEERCNPPTRHILNGMVYTLWGLRDVMRASSDKRATELWEQGVDSVAKSLFLFDTGYWSRYWIPEDDLNYVASIMYHNLHVVQLKALYQQTGQEVFKSYADRFEQYAGSPANRVKAVMGIWHGKKRLRAELN